VERIENCACATRRNSGLHSTMPGWGAPLFDGHNWKEWGSFPGGIDFDVACVVIESSLGFGCNSDAAFNARHYNYSLVGHPCPNPLCYFSHVLNTLCLPRLPWLQGNRLAVSCFQRPPSFPGGFIKVRIVPYASTPPRRARPGMPPSPLETNRGTTRKNLRIWYLVVVTLANDAEKARE
jgi:hypothetical protein